MATNRQTIRWALGLDGGDQVKAGLEAVAKSGEDAGSRIAAAFNKSQFGQTISRSLANLRANFAPVIASASNFGKAFGNLRTAIGTFAGFVTSAAKRLLEFKAVVLATAVGIGLLADKFASNAENIDQQAKSLGLTADTYQRLQRAAKNSGIEQGKFESILGKFGIMSDEAQRGLDGLATATEGVSNGFTNVATLGADGKLVFLQVANAAKDAVPGIVDLTQQSKKGETNMLAYARSVLSLKTQQEQLAKVSKDLGAKGAATTLAYLRSLVDEFDLTAQAAKGIIPPLSDAEVAIGVDLDGSIDDLKTNLGTLRDKFLAVFGPTISKLVKQFTKFLGDNSDDILAFANVIKDQLVSVIADLFALFEGRDQDVQNLWILKVRDFFVETRDAIKFTIYDIIIPAYEKYMEIANQVADLSNKVFGTEFTGNQIAAAGAILYFSGALGIMWAALKLAYSAGVLLKDLLLELGKVPLSMSAQIAGIALFGAAVIGVQEKLKELTGVDIPQASIAMAAANPPVGGTIFALAYWNDLRQKVREFFGLPNDSQITNQFFDAFKDLWDRLKKGADDAVTWVKNKMLDAIAAVRAAIRELQQLNAQADAAKASAAGGGGGGGGGGAFAGGGPVYGPGSSTSDSIPAMLSNNEFVIRAKAVGKVGQSFLAMVNSGRYTLAQIADRLRASRFSSGGLVPAMNVPIRHFAAGGPVTASPALRPVVINLNGEQFSMQTSDDVLNRLGRAASKQRTRSAGAKPKWW